MAVWQYLRDVFIVIGILLVVSGIVVGWAALAACALAGTYFATLIMGYRTGGKNGPTAPK